MNFDSYSASVRVGRGCGGGAGGGVFPNKRWISCLRNCQILFSICRVGMGGVVSILYQWGQVCYIEGFLVSARGGGGFLSSAI